MSHELSCRPSWDIFCAVIDNFGDIGVTWRLARQLAAEHGLSVRLWVDDLQVFAQICPDISPILARQRQQGVEVCQWLRSWQPVEVADVVVEAFACQLPADYITAMQQAGRRILWLNLEYLSAESWAADCHGLPSLQPSGLQKFFFFPGFQEKTGGLLRERSLLAERRGFQRSSVARQRFLGEWGINPPPDALWVSVFAYENAAIAAWLPSLTSAARPTLLLVPVSRVLGDIERALGVSGLKAGDSLQQGSLSVAILPFMSMDQYDRLLWCCDFNMVRGEDSFIRAQWAGRPFVWHIYPQEEGAHWLKLEAFLACYSQQLPTVSREVLVSFWQAWNGGAGADVVWPALVQALEGFTQHAEYWCSQQEALSDLAGKLVSFYSDWL